MIRFSTDDLPVRDRFDHWCEVRGRGLFGVTIELDREARGAFQGRFSAVMLGGAVVSELSASSYRVSRTTADVARMPSDSLLIGAQIRGPGRLETGSGRSQAIGEGDLIVCHSDLPYAATPDRPGDFVYRAIKLPLTDEILLSARACDLSASRVNVAAMLKPLAATFRAFARRDLGQADPAKETVHLARLAMLSRGRLMPGAPECRAALRAGYLHAAREILDRDLHRPQLTPTAMARELAISPRQVHVLFEPTGLSFGRTLTALRIARARLLLETAPSLSVTDIAFACGFDSIATFYRAFRTLCGMTPGEARAMAQTPHGAVLPADRHPMPA